MKELHVLVDFENARTTHPLYSYHTRIRKIA